MIKELRINKGRVQAVDLHRCQVDWRCVIWFTLTTTRQFTDETRSVDGHGRWWWLAYWRARRSYKEYTRLYRAKPGERSAKGWN